MHSTAHRNPTAGSADSAEAQRILAVLNNLIKNVGEAYVELSGHTAAMQTLVADMRRCGSFLQSRLVAEPVPAPWLSGSSRGASSTVSPAATPPARRGAFGQESTAGGTPVGAPPGFRSPPPVPPSLAAAASIAPSPVAAAHLTGAAAGSEAAVPGLSPAAPCTPASSGRAAAPQASTPSPAASSAQSSRPPLGGPRAASVGRSGPAARPPAAGTRNHHPNMPAAGRPSGVGSGSRTRDASPQRRVGGTAGSAASVPLRSASPVAAPAARSAGSAAPDAAPQPDVQGNAVTAGGNTANADSVGGSSSSRTSNPYLPLAAQRALAAAASLEGGADGQGAQDYRLGQQPADAPPKPAGPPQLPLALRRAMQRYKDTLQTRDQLLQQYKQRRGSSPDCAGPTLADTVAAAGRSYRAALARQYPSAGSRAAGRGDDGASGGVGAGSSGGAAGASAAAAHLSRMSLTGAVPGSPPSAAELRRRAQVVFAALVAAQTWLIQSLTELARSRGTPGGVAAANRRAAQADTCAALLRDVELLRMELAELQEQISAVASSAAAAPALPSPPPSAVAVAASMCGRVGSSPDALSGVAAALGIDDQELEEAAALWRNRFLRALLGEVGLPAGGSGGSSGARRGGQGGLGATTSRPPPQPVASQQLHQIGLAGPSGGDPSPGMGRPLGFWLPDAMWAHVGASGNDGSADMTASAACAPRPGSSSASHQLSLNPWNILLPPSDVYGLQPALSSGRHEAAAAAAPPALLCASAADAVAHGRAQLQLQATVFQQLLEAALAAPLLPRQPPSAPPGLQLALAASDRLAHHPHQHPGQQHRHQAAALAWERWLAQCRLAHLLLFKGAWNRLCSVVQLEEEDPGEDDGQEPV